MEEKIREKKELSFEEIEAQTLLELPDRQLMQTVYVSTPTIVAVQLALNIATIIFFGL